MEHSLLQYLPDDITLDDGKSIAKVAKLLQ